MQFSTSKNDLENIYFPIIKKSKYLKLLHYCNVLAKISSKIALMKKLGPKLNNLTDTNTYLCFWDKVKGTAGLSLPWQH